MANEPRAVLVGVQLPGVDEAEHRASLEELRRLADTLGVVTVGTLVQRRDRLEPAAVLGAGKLVELARWTDGPGAVPNPAKQKAKKQAYLGGGPATAGGGSANPPAGSGPAGPDEPEDDEDDAGRAPEEKATLILVDHDLTPSQARNLERATGAEVMDRTSVILGIFHRHARSREAKLEVEMARLKYLAPRLREGSGGGDRQRGGIGGKGAGESALELDRRKIRDRIAELGRELDLVRKVAETQRSRRTERRKAALVGYTNAGKSSMMRALTGSEIYVADALFATLGTTVRLLPGVTPRILVSDTVGFIKKLPHDLVASFRATLDEAASAELLLHVVDAADPAFRTHMEVTERLLGELGVSGEQRLLLNKRDRLSEAEQAELQREFPDATLVSAHQPDSVEQVVQAVVEFFDRDTEELELFVDWASQARLPSIHERCRVLGSEAQADGLRLRVRADPAARAAFDDLLAPPG